MRSVDVEGVPFIEVDRFPALDKVEHGELFALSLSNRTVDLTHGLHRFPGKFIPQIPRWALDEFAGPGAMVVDPFAGSGTTLVETAVRGCRGVGFDIDPLARLIAGAKTSPADHRSLVRLLAQLESRFSGKRMTTDPPPMSGVENFGHWFTKRNARELAELFVLIQDLRCTKVERQFLLACFSASVRWVSNADDQTQKTYVSGTRPKSPPPAFDTFLRFAARACRGLAEMSEQRHPDTEIAIEAPLDSFRLGLPDASADLFITSPPYVDSVDYMYNFMLEYFWLGPLLGIPDRAAFNLARRQYLGAKSPASPVEESTEYAPWLGSLAGLSPDRRRAVFAYLAGMDAHFAEAARCLRADGHYVLVVGNSQTLKTIMPIHDALLKLAGHHQLELVKAFGYRVRRHYMKFPRSGRGGIILIDWVMILRKVGGQAKDPAPLPLPWATLHRHAVAN